MKHQISGPITQKLLSKQNLALKLVKEAEVKDRNSGAVKKVSDKNLINLYQQEKKHNQNRNVMRVIKGGGGTDKEKNQKKFFFEKKMSTKNIQLLNDLESAPLSNRRDFEKRITEKYENQMKILQNEYEEDNSSGFHSEDD